MHVVSVASNLFDFSLHFISFLIISLINLLFLLPDTFNFHDVVDKPCATPLRTLAPWPRITPPQKQRFRTFVPSRAALRAGGCWDVANIHYDQKGPSRNGCPFSHVVTTRYDSRFVFSDLLVKLPRKIHRARGTMRLTKGGQHEGANSLWMACMTSSHTQTAHLDDWCDYTVK